VQVLVVGAGPVGLTAAAELARFGVPVRIVDKAAARSDKSKALVVWSRTLELMDAMGCAEALIAAGLKSRSASIYARGRQLATVSFDGVDSPHPYGLMLPQSETERLLEHHLEQLGISVERQTELVGFAQDSGCVTASLRHDGGSEETLRADWLVGCDGAHSTVRHVLGMPFAGSTQPSDWVLADVHLAGSSIGTGEISLFWHAEGVLACFPITPGRWRVIADLGNAAAHDHPADPTLPEVQSLLDRRGPGGLVTSDPIWLSAFRINERKVASYRQGRAFLVGDAAHVHSPAGGQGMNTGIQDACNLAWKLALICRGAARDGLLLDSYSLERSAVGEMVLRNAGRLTTVAILRNPIGQAVRNTLIGLLAQLPGVQRKIAATLTELDIAYPKTPLNKLGAAAPRGRGIPQPGDRASPRWQIGAPTTREPRFTLVLAGVLAGQSRNDGPAIPHAAAALAKRFDGLLTLKATGSVEDKSGLWLVRPDGYIALAAGPDEWNAVDAHLGTMLG
jgi:2-polyprenyl-6-methoxyphenol hydroxylase-like FAD-dependent oxidoreductase